MQYSVKLSDSLPTVCRLGLATRGNTHLLPDDVGFALEKGIQFWNWCGYEDGMSQAVRDLGSARSEVILGTQIQSTDRDSLLTEVEAYLKMLRTDRLDIATIYYLETRAEWENLNKSRGVIETLKDLQAQGTIGLVGVTSHQRKLAASIAEARETGLLMIRHNAAHRGAEDDIFPITDRRGVPVIAYTCLRWGALIQPQADNESTFTIPTAPDCYRFVLSNPSVSVALMAPDTRQELEENLTLLDQWKSMTSSEIERIREWGDHVHRNAGQFP